MEHILQNVMPVGTPWGGPESIRYLSGFVSALMCVEGEAGTEQELRRRHEWLYHLYLAVTGIGVSTVWSPGTDPCTTDQMVDALFDDTIARTMAYAGLRHRVVERDEIAPDPDAARRSVVASIDRRMPVLVCAPGSEWSIVAGYADGGGTWIGWDGEGTYWGSPAAKPDGYLPNGMFRTAARPETWSRLVLVEGRTTPSTSSRSVFRHLAAVMEGQQSPDLDADFRQMLEDDGYLGSAGAAELRRAYDYTHGYVGFYAEARCFVSCAFREAFVGMADVRGVPAAVAGLERAAGALMDSHATCWDAWKAMRRSHPCDPKGSAREGRCGQCGRCLRPATEEDYEEFRRPESRRRIAAHVRRLSDNDRHALAELRQCIALV